MIHNHDILKESIRDVNIPIVVYIDDVDRLEKEELMTLLRLIRDTADFPNMFYILAADEDYLIKTLEQAGFKNPSSFIKKFINYNFKLPADENAIEKILRGELTKVLSTYLLSTESGISISGNESNNDEAVNIVNQILKIDNVLDVFDNPRNIYRIINSYSFMLDSFKANRNHLIVNCVDLFILCLIQNINPKVFEILRNSYGTLLNYSKGRFVLKKEYKNLFPTRANEELQKKLQKGVTNNQEKKEYERNFLSYNKIIETERPTRDQLTSAFLTFLFGDGIGYRKSNRICLIDNYFSYFSAHKKSTEISTSECTFIMSLQTEEFMEHLETLFNCNQKDSFEMRVPYVAEKFKRNKSKFLQYVFIYYDYKWRIDGKKYVTIKSLQEYYSIPRSTDLLEKVCFRLYNSSLYQNGDEEKWNEIYKKLQDLFKVDVHYYFLLLVLGYLNYKRLGYEIKKNFNSDSFDSLLDILIDRYIKHLEKYEIVCDSEFLTIKHFTEFGISGNKWKVHFLEYLYKKDNYMAWFYMMFSFDSNGKIVCDENIKRVMLPSDGYYIDELIKQYGDENLKDLKQISHNNEDINTLSPSEHPFLRGLENYLKAQKH